MTDAPENHQESTAAPAAAGKKWAVAGLVVSIVFVLVCLVGAKMVYDRERLAPVGVTYYPAPYADDARCTDFLSALPEDIGDFTRVPIIDPAPAGAAAFSFDSRTRITVRCGVDLPFQYTALSDTVDTAGVTWLKVTDPTTGSDLVSFYTTNRFPVAVVTTTTGQLRDNDPLDMVAGAAETLQVHRHPLNPTPLSGLETVAGGTGKSDCTKLLQALPATIGGSAGYTRATPDQLADAGVEQPAAAWVADGLEPVVLRCGVPNSAEYKPGVSLQQVNGIAWFEDTVLSNGTTAGTWYLQGRSTTVAVSVPQSVAPTAMLEISDTIADNIGEK